MTVLNKNEFLSLSDEDKWSKYRNLNITLIKHKKSSYVIKEKQYVMLRGLQKIIRVIDMLFDHPYNSTGELYSKKRNANAKLIQDLKSSIRYSVLSSEEERVLEDLENKGGKE